MNALIARDIFKEPFWGLDMAMDQFFGGLAVGLFLLSIFLDKRYFSTAKGGARIAALTAPICVGISGLFLITHLSQPLRFPLAFLNFNVTSPISWGSWLQAGFGIITVLHALSYLNSKKYPFRKLTTLAGIPFAVGTGFYHGFVLMVIRAHSMWNTGPIVIMTLAGFALSAVSLLVILMVIFGKKEELNGLSLLRNFIAVAIFAQLLTLFLWISAMFFGQGNSYFMLNRFFQMYGLPFLGGVVFLGLLIPLLIGGVPLLKNDPEKPVTLTSTLISSILLLAGSGLLRYIILMAEQ